MKLAKNSMDKEKRLQVFKQYIEICEKKERVCRSW